jgi:hypothetical protein
MCTAVAQFPLYAVLSVRFELHAEQQILAEHVYLYLAIAKI